MSDYEPEFTPSPSPLFKMTIDERIALKDEIVRMEAERQHCDDAAKKLAAPYKARVKELAIKIRERIDTLNDDENPRMLKSEALPRIRTRDAVGDSVKVNADEVAKTMAKVMASEAKKNNRTP
jgi:hypothetical protein